MKWKWKSLCGVLTLCNPMDCTVHGILQATILEWVALPFSRGSFQPRDWTQVSLIAGNSLPAELSEAEDYWVLLPCQLVLKKEPFISSLSRHSAYIVILCLYCTSRGLLQRGASWVSAINILVSKLSELLKLQCIVNHWGILLRYRFSFSSSGMGLEMRISGILSGDADFTNKELKGSDCIFISSYIVSGLPWWFSDKESPCNSGDARLIPGLGRSPAGGHDNPISFLAWKVPWTEEPGGL